MNSRSHGIVQEFCEDNFKTVEDISKAHELFEKYSKKRRELENQLSVVSTEVPTNINSALQLAQTSLNRSNDVMKQAENITINVDNALETANPAIASVKELLFNANEFDKYIKYFKWIVHVQEENSAIQEYLENENVDQACTHFVQLVSKYDELISKNTGCINLVKYVSNTIIFWQQSILAKLEPEFSKVLKSIEWPFLNFAAPDDINELLKHSTQSSSKQRINGNRKYNFHKLFENLLLLQLPDKLDPDYKSSNGDSGNIILLPIKLLVKPFVKRFQYHFSGNKPTNDIGKPEWYLTQVLNWVSNHVGILEHSIQPLLYNTIQGKYSSFNAVVMFTQSLLSLVYKKLSCDMDALLTDDALFAHVVDEILLFDREVNATHELVSIALENIGPINILTQPECLQKWINTEKLCALSRLDDNLSKPEAWTCKFNATTEESSKLDSMWDEEKVPECTDLFVTMLLTITDRYKRVSSWKDQIKFLDLQLHLLDDYRIRLTQVLKNEVMNNPLGDVHFAVINAAHYVTNLLQEWSENLFFLELQHQASNSEENESHSRTFVEDQHSLFSSILLLYKRLYNEACDNIHYVIVNEIKNKAKPFIDNNWLMRASHDDKVILTVSRSACPMLQLLQQKLSLLETKLNLHLFTVSWKNISEMIDLFLFKELIASNKFSKTGCSQVEFDLVRNLFPLLGSYTQKPDNYFRRLKESCILLTLAKGSALLVMEILTTTPKGTRPKEALSDLKVTLLSASEVLLLLKLRVDLL